ncbi:MAG TPA: response regulator [Candidatus Polarisedimenticolia bacterium]|nr:response regulator [Candidatus Polarisedimenticolia bacterium]
MPKKILLADDSITIQKVVELTFSEGDYQVYAVGNGSQALRKIHEVRPDIALLDVIMPEANGYEVCEKVKGDPTTSRIPVLLLTGTFEPFDKNRAQAVGADGHLTKPFESQVLIARVEELIAMAAPAVTMPAGVREAIEEPTAEAPEPAGAAQEVEVRIVPDRYDDEPSARREFGSEAGESIQTVHLDPEDIPPPSSSSEEASAGTWDELASGLSSAPLSSRPETEERAPMRGESAMAREAEQPISAEAVQAAYAAETHGETGGNGLSPDQVDRIASRVVEKLSDRIVREIAWEVIPEIAENLIRQRIRELEEKISREG